MTDIKGMYGKVSGILSAENGPYDKAKSAWRAVKGFAAANRGKFIVLLVLLSPFIAVALGMAGLLACAFLAGLVLAMPVLIVRQAGNFVRTAWRVFLAPFRFLTGFGRPKGEKSAQAPTGASVARETTFLRVAVLLIIVLAASFVLFDTFKTSMGVALGDVKRVSEGAPAETAFGVMFTPRPALAMGEVAAAQKAVLSAAAAFRALVDVFVGGLTLFLYITMPVMLAVGLPLATLLPGRGPVGTAAKAAVMLVLLLPCLAGGYGATAVLEKTLWAYLSSAEFAAAGQPSPPDAVAVVAALVIMISTMFRLMFVMMTFFFIGQTSRWLAGFLEMFAGRVPPSAEFSAARREVFNG